MLDGYGSIVLTAVVAIVAVGADALAARRRPCRLAVASTSAVVLVAGYAMLERRALLDARAHVQVRLGALERGARKPATLPAATEQACAVPTPASALARRGAALDARTAPDDPAAPDALLVAGASGRGAERLGDCPGVGGHERLLDWYRPASSSGTVDVDDLVVRRWDGPLGLCGGADVAMGVR